MEHQSKSHDLSDGDLGLGDGFKPGGLPPLPDEASESIPQQNLKCELQNHSTETPSHSECSSLSGSDEEFELSLLPIQPIRDLKDEYKPNKTSARSKETRIIANPPTTLVNEEQNTHQCPKDEQSEFPVYAEVPYGTSLKQQKKLFQHNIEELKKKWYQNNYFQSDSSSDIESKNKVCTTEKLTSEKIAQRLADTLQEVDDLKTELETCEMRLDSKYKAISILRKQAEDAQLQLKVSRKMSQDKTVKLAQVSFGDGGAVLSTLVGDDRDLGEGNPLTWAPTHTQQTPAAEPRKVPRAKYLRACKENESLKKTLGLRTDELRRMSARKMAVERENDELLALLDIQERAKYEHSRSVSFEENYCTFTSTELAVLGACRCRVSEPDPCGCAHAAANTKREVCRLREEMLQYKRRRDEAFMTVDAYRLAFEEQLQKNKVLSTRLSHLATSTQPRVSRARTAFRWLIGTLSDEEGSDDEASTTRVMSSPPMTDQEIITYLTELLHEKKEVLAHQKLAAQILGDRVKALEEKLAGYDKDDVFT